MNEYSPGMKKCSISILRVYPFGLIPLGSIRCHSSFKDIRVCVFFQILFSNKSLLALCSVYCQKCTQLFNKIYATREDEEQTEIFSLFQQIELK